MSITFILLSIIATNIVWERTYPGCNFIDVHQTSDYGFIVAGYKYLASEVFSQEQNDDSANQPYLFKLSETGDLEWSTRVIETPYGGSIQWVEELPDGGYVATGYFICLAGGDISQELFLARLNEDGEVLWFSFQPSDNTEKGFAVSQLPTGGFVVLGVSNWAIERGTFILLFFDEAGTEIFRTSWGQASGERLSSTGYIIGTDNDRILLCGSAYPRDWPPHPIQACFSYDGEQLWYREYFYGLWGREGYIRADGDCWFCTAEYALQIDTLSGYIINAIHLDINPREEVIYSCDITFDGGLIAAGFRDYSGPIDCSGSTTMTEETEDGWIIKLSETGEIMWQEHLENIARDQSFYSVRQLSTGGYIAAGEYSGSGGWLVRFEPEFGIESPEGNCTNLFVPCPSGGNVSARVFLDDQSIISITVYDMIGRIVVRRDHELLPEGYNEVQLGSLVPGAYICRMHTDDTITDVKFVVIE